MNLRTLLLLFVSATISTCLHAQGPACTTNYAWFVSGFAGFGPDPDYSYAIPIMMAAEAQVGGAGPICSTSWYTEAPPGNWTFFCYATKWSCKPQSPPVGGPSCPDCGEPISLANGNVSIQETDVRIPGLGGGLTLTRTWNSTWLCYYLCQPIPGSFGTGWRSTYEESLSASPDGTMMVYYRADGSAWAFASYGSPPAFHLISPSNVPTATLTEQGTTSPVWTVTFENGEQRIFNGFFGGPLSAIVDRNGNTTSLTYTPTQFGSITVNRLTRVTDQGGHNLNFAYDPNSTYLVSNISSDSGTGINVSYSYTMQYLGDIYSGPVLTQVTQSDGTTLNFTYDAWFNITNVTDTNGKILESHVYGTGGCNGGLSSTRANGVDALTVSFPNMYSYCSPGGVGYPLGAQ